MKMTEEAGTRRLRLRSVIETTTLKLHDPLNELLPEMRKVKEELNAHALFLAS